MNIIDSNINSFLIKQQQQNGIKEITGSDGKRENKKKGKVFGELVQRFMKKIIYLLYFVAIVCYKGKLNI